MRANASFYTSISVVRSPDHMHETFNISVTEGVDLFLAIGFSHILDEALCRNTMYSMVQMLQQALFDNTSGDYLKAFEAGLKEVNLYLGKRNLSEIGLLHSAIGLRAGESLHITKTGNGEIYLCRKKACIHITADFEESYEGEENVEPTIEDMMGDGEEEFFSNMASGDLEKDDVVLFSSNRLSLLLDSSQLTAYFGKAKLEVGFLNLESKIKGCNECDVAIIGMKQEEIQIPVAPQKPKQPSISPLRRNTPDSEPTEIESPVRSSINQFISRNSQAMRDPQKRRNMYTFGIVVVLVLLVLSVGASLSNNQNEQLKIEFETKYNEARNELTLAKNETIKGDLDAARGHVTAAKDIALEIKDMNIATTDVAELLGEITEVEDTANNVSRIADSDIYMNLEGKLDGETPKGLIHMEEKMYVYTVSSIYGPFVSASGDAGKKYPLPTTDVILDVIPFDDAGGLLIKLTPDKVAEFVNNNYSFTDTTGVKLGSFGSNIYVLGNDQVWRYTRSRSSYRGPTPWLAQTDSSLETAVSMAIDGNIYLLMRDGSLRMYNRGNRVEDFDIRNAPAELFEGINEKSKILASPEWSKLYLFNQSTGAVAVFSFDGANAINFEQQILFEGVSIETITISEDESTLYGISSDLKVYRKTL